MNLTVAPMPSNGIVLFCPKLRADMSHLARSVIVRVCTSTSDIFLSTRSRGSAISQQKLPNETFVKSLGQIVTCEELCDASALSSQFPPDILRSAEPYNRRDAGWRLFSCKFINGTEDRFAIRLLQTIDSAEVIGFLKANWSMLREKCLHEACDTSMEVCDKAMQWMVTSRMNVAILVMNGRGAMLRANDAAVQLLRSGTVLRRSPLGICCNDERQTAEFLALLAKCAASDPFGPEQVMFIQAEASAVRVPATMTRFWYENMATDLVTVMVPMPPDSNRVEMLARAIGLTPAEARIASLMQMGLSNKDAAKISGLKEQSVSTYAKRALSKLNVNSRAEMAQMLTWQSAGGSL